MKVLTQRMLAVGHRRFGTAYRPHLKGSNTDKLSQNVVNYHHTLRNKPEELGSHSHCGGSLKSRHFGQTETLNNNSGLYRALWNSSVGIATKPQAG